MRLHLTYLLFNAKRNKILCKIYIFSVVASVDNFRLHWHTLGWCNVRSAVNRVWYKNTKLLLLWNWMYTEENVTCMVMVHSHLKWYECPNKWAYLHTMVLAQFHLGFAFFILPGDARWYFLKILFFSLLLDKESGSIRRNTMPNQNDNV